MRKELARNVSQWETVRPMKTTPERNTKTYHCEECGDKVPVASICGSHPSAAIVEVSTTVKIDGATMTQRLLRVISALAGARDTSSQAYIHLPIGYPNNFEEACEAATAVREWALANGLGISIEVNENNSNIHVTAPRMYGGTDTLAVIFVPDEWVNAIEGDDDLKLKISERDERRQIRAAQHKEAADKKAADEAAAQQAVTEVELVPEAIL